MRLNLLFATTMLATVSAAATSAGAVSFALTTEFNDPNPRENGRFGASVALNGDRIAVGADGAGRAFIFDRFVGPEGEDTFISLNDPTPNRFDNFGHAIALDDDKVLVGAPGDSTQGISVGQAHLFDAISGSLLRTFDSPVGVDRETFGFSVALEGDKVLVGSRLVGQAHLFDATSGSLLQSFNDPTPATGVGSFGRSVAIDGDMVLIGEPFDRTRGNDVGQAHLFSAIDGTLIHTFNDPTPTGDQFTGDQFGSAVALDHGLVLIGAPLDETQGLQEGQAYLFEAASGNLLHIFDNPTPNVLPGTSGGEFGRSVTLDGNNVLIGAPKHRTVANSGAAHLFDAITGAHLHTFLDPEGVNGAGHLGTSVAMDGNIVLIGGAQDSSLGRVGLRSHGEVHLFVADTTPIPVPAPLALLASAVIGLGVATRRRRG